MIFNITLFSKTDNDNDNCQNNDQFSDAYQDNDFLYPGLALRP